MIIENNPEVDVVELKKKIQATLENFPKKPDTRALLSTTKILASYVLVDEKTQKILGLNVARTEIPRSLNRFPFNKVPFLGRFIVFLDRALFSRQREINKEVLDVIGVLIENQKDLSSDIQILVSQLKDSEGVKKSHGA